MPYFRVPCPIGRTRVNLYKVGDGRYKIDFYDCLDRVGLPMRGAVVEGESGKAIGISEETQPKMLINHLSKTGPRGQLIINQVTPLRGIISATITSVFGNSYERDIIYDGRKPPTTFKGNEQLGTDRKKGVSRNGEIVSRRKRDLARLERVVRTVLTENYQLLEEAGIRIPRELLDQE